VDSLNGQVVLVTGANGFLGRHLLASLGQQGAIVHAVSRNMAPERYGAQWWLGNVTDARWIRDLVVRLNPEVIYQLTSASSGGQDPALIMSAFESDLHATVNTLDAARQSGCRRVIITRSLEEPVDALQATPASPYAAAKLASGIYGRMFHKLYKVPVVMLRPYMTYGPGQKDHKVLPYAIQSMLRNQTPQLASGTRLVDWVYVEDVISGFISAAVKPEAIGREIDLGSGSLVSIRDVIAEIQKIVPDCPEVKFGSMRDRVNEETRKADLETARECLAWSPVTSLRAGLEKTVEWYQRKLDVQPAGAAAGAVNA
jgi:UDP-glucose 4-epimerase